MPASHLTPLLTNLTSQTSQYYRLSGIRTQKSVTKLANSDEYRYSYNVMETIEVIAETTQIYFGTESQVLAVFLLGSSIRGQLRPDSDIDLALMLYPGKSINPVRRMEIAGELAYLLKRPVDLGEISSRNLVYAREALLTGIPVHVSDPDKMNLLRANLLGMYLQFNEDRKEVLDAYRA